MKKLLALMLCLALALTLVACGKDDKDKDKPNTDLPTNNQPNTAPNNGTNGDTKPDGGVTSPGNGTDDDILDNGTVNDGAQSKMRRGTGTYGYNYGTNADGMATWRQMIDNGRVRDTDGFLQDGENASWS